MSEKTLEEAKQVLRDNWEDGVECPCCSQYVKLYKRRMNKQMAKSLVLLSNETGWFHLDEAKDKRKFPTALAVDFAKLRFWGLIEQAEGVRIDGSTRSGFWRITNHGRMFINLEVSVKSHVKIYNNASYGLTGDYVLIDEVLCSEGFNYQELMDGI